jgi:hypothetical protein
MSGYAVKNDGTGWRAVNSQADVDAATETYSAAQPVMTLVQAQSAQNALINASRDSACAANVAAMVSGTSHSWQADDRSVALLNGAITVAQNGGALPPAWRTADNINVTIAALADLLAIANAISSQVQAAYAKSWTLKANIAAATTVAQVQAVVW